MGNSNIMDMVMPLATLGVIYLALDHLGLLPAAKKTLSDTVTAACPRGKKYARTVFNAPFGDCDPNYLMSDFLGIPGLGSGNLCECQSKGTITPAQDKDKTITKSIPDKPDAVDCDIVCQIKKAAAALFTPTPAQSEAQVWAYQAGLGKLTYNYTQHPDYVDYGEDY